MTQNRLYSKESIVCIHIMASIKHFDELVVWKKSRKLTNEIYISTQTGLLSKDYGLKDQIQRATVSVMSNIAEGFGYRSDPQFLKYLNIARGSICEVQSILYVALDIDYISNKRFNELLDLSTEIIFLIAALQRYLRKS